jgi:hypothetical protein
MLLYAETVISPRAMNHNLLRFVELPVQPAYRVRRSAMTRSFPLTG